MIENDKKELLTKKEPKKLLTKCYMIKLNNEI